MNDIENARKEIRKYFDPSRGIEGSEDFEVSPSGNFRLETKEFSQTKSDINWIVTRVCVFDLRSEEKIFEFIADDNNFFHAWGNKDQHELLLCSEILEGGQTIIDLTDRHLTSYSPVEVGFIWASFFLSPMAKRFAVAGCYWACPSEIRIYDFTDPHQLPLKLLESINLKSEDKTHVNWLNDDIFEIPTKGGSIKTYHV